MAFKSFLKFALTCGSLYLTKDLGQWSKQSGVTQSNNSEPLEGMENDKIPIKQSTLVQFDKGDQNGLRNTTECLNKDKEQDCICKSQVPSSWSNEFKEACQKSLKTMQKIPSHWRRFTENVQESLRQFFKSDK